MATFTAGTSFTDGVTGDVTAAKLNKLVADATPLPNLITDRVAETSIATDDLVLISDTSDSNALNKMTVANFYLSSSRVTHATGTAGTVGIGPTGDANTGLFYPSADTVAISTGGTERARIDSSGRVGIGTTSPSAKLTVASGDILVSDGYGIGAGVGSQVIYNGTSNYIRFDTDSTERLRIDPSGRVGIGTTTPNSKLHVYGLGDLSSSSNNVRNIAYFQADSTVANSSIIFDTNPSAGQNLRGFYFGYQTPFFAISRFHTDKTTGVVNDLVISSSGNIGISTDTPNAKLSTYFSGASVAGSHFINSDSGSSSQNYIIFYRNISNIVGSITCTDSATSYNTSSDYRLKTKIEPISNGIERIKQLPVYRFNWKSDENGDKVDGFIAHEAQSVVPECVTGAKDAVDSDGKPIYQGIDQSKIVPLLTAALKEAIARIETLESKVAVLEAA